MITQEWWARKRRQRGSGLLIAMVLLVVMVVYLSANAAQIDRLRRTLDRVEKQQIERIQPRAPKNPPKAEAEAPPH